MKALEELNQQFLEEAASCSSAGEAEALRLKFLGRKGLLARVRKSIDFKTLTPGERGEVGKGFNDLKNLMESGIRDIIESLGDTASVKKAPVIDMTLPGSGKSIGALHPVTLVQMELESIFMGMGFYIESGFDVETEYYNFEALNTPSDHPAREMQDTFWLKNGLVLRTQTSANQVRALEKFGVPMKAIFPGRCFRYETIDASHENTFYQLEGLVVDRNITVANLISVMKLLLNQVFHREVKTRLRPGYFPFVEPGFELDINCLICGGKGCKTCKNTGWIELLPCGIVHPNVLRHGKIDPEKWSGFAFGLGLTRLAMMKYGIPDIRVFNGGDIRVLEQFTANV
ncbi:MAG: phenylalanine--tRNA ligase subunit alpha [Candidatus Latescibacteria bacterium]|nr:phenylalanine--tRNA ligase subunit alpha [Candidatus Latescibacterota bacterium]